MKETTTQLPLDKTSVSTSPSRVDGVGLVSVSAKLVTFHLIH